MSDLIGKTAEEKDLQASMMYGKDFRDIVDDLVLDAEESLVCSDISVWTEFKSNPQKLRMIDSWGEKEIWIYTVNGILMPSNEMLQTIINFTAEYLTSPSRLKLTFPEYRSPPIQMNFGRSPISF